MFQHFHSLYTSFDKRIYSQISDSFKLEIHTSICCFYFNNVIHTFGFVPKKFMSQEFSTEQCIILSILRKEWEVQKKKYIYGNK